MEFFKYIKQLYSCENAFEKHIILFSIIGLMAIMANNICSIMFNNIFTTHITTMPANDIEVYVDIIFGLIFWFYLIGYEYFFINNYLNTKKICLPDFTDKPISVFFKMVEVFVIWQVYFVIFAYLCTKIFLNQNMLYSYLLATLMLSVTPFVFMIYVKYAKDFRFTKSIINPFLIIKYFDVALIDIVLWCVKFGIFSVIPISAIMFMLKFINIAKTQAGQISLYLFSLCLIGYLFMIMKLLFAIGISNIVNKKYEELQN